MGQIHVSTEHKVATLKEWDNLRQGLTSCSINSHFADNLHRDTANHLTDTDKTKHSYNQKQH